MAQDALNSGSPANTPRSVNLQQIVEIYKSLLKGGCRMTYGCTGRILEVDLTTGSISYRETREEDIRKYLGAVVWPLDPL